LKNWRVFELALLGLAAGLIAWQLFAPPSLGVADNNDFPKLIGRYCLGPAGDHPLFEYVSFAYERGPSHCWDSGLITSAVLPLRLAMLIQPRRFDLRVLGAVYTLLFLAAFYEMQRLARRLSAPRRAILPVVALLIFCSATYVPWFNSFYFDTASLVFLFWSAVFVCRLVLADEIRLRDYLLAAVSVVLFASSKAQHAPLALLLMPGLWLSFRRPRFPAVWVRSLATAAIVAAAILMWTTAPPWYESTNIYNALFYQALPRSAHPVADLAELGIDGGMLRYVGQHAFLADSPLQKPGGAEAFGRQMSARKLAVYYVAHPKIAGEVMRNALREASLEKVRMEIGSRQYRLGNYEKVTGYPPETQSGFLDGWTAIKTWVFGNRPWIYAGYAVALLGILWRRAWRSGEKARLRIVYLTATLTAMLVVGLGVVLFDGVDMGRHMLIFNTLLDLGVCAVVAIPNR
jgi:hypothetical protein